MRRPVPASPTAATASPALMISGPTHSRVIMPAAITGREPRGGTMADLSPPAPPLKAHISQIEHIDKHVDHANRVTLVNEIIEAFGQ